MFTLNLFTYLFLWPLFYFLISYFFRIWGWRSWWWCSWISYVWSLQKYYLFFSFDIFYQANFGIYFYAIILIIKNKKWINTWPIVFFKIVVYSIHYHYFFISRPSVLNIWFIIFNFPIITHFSMDPINVRPVYNKQQ